MKFPPPGARASALGPILYAAGIVTGAVAAVLVLRTQSRPVERNDHEDQDDEAGRAKTGGAPAAVTETTTEQSEKEQDNE